MKSFKPYKILDPRFHRFHNLWKIIFVCLLGCGFGYADNPVQIENAKPGATNWQLSNPAANREIEGYASLTSVNIGSQISFFVSTSDPAFDLEIFRSGWYGGLGARSMMSIPDLAGSLQATPDPDPVTGLTDCQWKSSYTLTVPATWTSGIYLARLSGKVSGKQSYIIFVVRDDDRSSDLVFQCSVTTYQAYNFWPGGNNGKSLYGWAPGGRGWKVSFNRPYTLGMSYDADHPGAAAGIGAGEYLTLLQPGVNNGYPIPIAGFEYNMVRWLEANGYDVTYTTDIDTHENAAALRNHKAFLSVGHDEYWSMQMANNLQNALSAGVNAGFFSANTMYWQVRFEADALGHSDRVMVCYKSDALASDPMYPVNPRLTTTSFRSYPVNMPEAGIVGVEYVADPVTSDIVISNASHWLMNGTGLHNGDHLKGLLGYEVDAFIPGTSPASATVLASSPIGAPPHIDNPPGFNCQSGACRANTIWYSTGRSSVLATGSMYWSWGLDDFNAPALRPAYASPAAQQLTKNVLAALIQSVAITTPGLPDAVAGNAYNPYQLSIAGGSAPYLWSASNLPSGMALSASGVLSGTPVSAGTGNIAVAVTDSAGHSATTLLTLMVQTAAGSPGDGSPSINTAALPFGVAGAPFAQTLRASGGASPYRWSVVSGNLPPGLTLSIDGQVTGTPETVGIFNLTVAATDGNSQSVTHALQFVSIGVVDPFLTSSMDTTRWCQCVPDQAPGSQNPQVSVQQSDGQFSITPQPGLSGLNYNGYQALTSLDMTDAALSVQVVQAATGSGYTDTSFVLAADAQNWYRFIVEGGSLYFQSMVSGAKTGASIPYDAVAHQYWRLRHDAASSQMFFETSPTGASWTVQWQAPAVVAVNSLFTALNAGTWGPDQNTGQVIFANLRWEGNSSPLLPYITVAPLEKGTTGAAYTSTLTTVDSTSPVRWSLVSGSLPAGLTLTASGQITGTPTAVGTFRFTAQAKDTYSLTATEVFQIEIVPGALTVATVTLPNGTINAAYNQTLTAQGGTPAYQWSLVSGSLPAGLTLTASGQIIGMPTVAGTFSFTVQVKDAASLTATRSLQLAIPYSTAITLSFASAQLTYPGATNVVVTVSGTKTPTGAVTLYDGASPLTTLNLQGDGKAYWYISPGLATGAHQISAAYKGDANNAAGQSAPVTVTVSAVPVRLSASCWNSSFVYGQNYSCTINVGSNAGSASGAVAYTLDSNSPITVPLNYGNAQFTLSKPEVGTHTVAIQYAQQGNFAASQTSVQSFTVTLAPIAENITASSYWARQGTPVTLSVVLSSWSAGAPNQEGNMSFYDGATLLGTVPVNSDGTASFTANTLAVGQHSIRANYSGSPRHISATASLNLTIAQ